MQQVRVVWCLTLVQALSHCTCGKAHVLDARHLVVWRKDKDSNSEVRCRTAAGTRRTCRAPSPRRRWRCWTRPSRSWWRACAPRPRRRCATEPYRVHQSRAGLGTVICIAWCPHNEPLPSCLVAPVTAAVSGVSLGTANGSEGSAWKLCVVQLINASGVYVRTTGLSVLYGSCVVCNWFYLLGEYVRACGTIPLAYGGAVGLASS